MESFLFFHYKYICDILQGYLFRALL